MKRRLLILNLLLLGALGVSGCVKYNGVPQEEVVESPIKLTLSVESLNLVVGDGGKTFSVTVSSEEVEIKDNKVTIANSDKEVIEIDAEEVESDAKVRVKALKDGDATLTITSKQDENAKATLAVKVSSGDGTAAVESVAITNKTMSVKVGETKKIEYVVSPENASNKDVEFTSSDTTGEYISLDTTGGITGKKATSSPVTVTIKTKDGGKTDTCSVTVEAALEKGSLYLIGSSQEFGGFSKPNAIYKLRANDNPQYGAVEEYMVDFAANGGDQFKVVKMITDEWVDAARSLQWFDIDTSFVGNDFSEDDCATTSTYGSDPSLNVKIRESGTYRIYFDIGRKQGNAYKYYVAKVRN